MRKKGFISITLLLILLVTGIFVNTTGITAVSESSEVTPKPSAAPKPDSSENPLKKVSGVKLTRYSTHAVKVTWKKNKKAKYYRVYYSQDRDGEYELAGVTKKGRYLVNKLKKDTKYYFYVQACRKKTVSEGDSTESKKVSIKTKKYKRKIIFAGDSITKGIADYGLKWKMNGAKKVVAHEGLNTITFHTKRIFNGQTGLQKIISEKPYRVYMMLGINEIHYRTADAVLTEYKALLQEIRRSCPNTDIVVCAVSPVTEKEKANRPGFGKIPKFNKGLKKLTKETGTHYFDYTGFLKDSNGNLKKKYASSDGCHWKIGAYTEFVKCVEAFEKTLDK